MIRLPLLCAIKSREKKKPTPIRHATNPTPVINGEPLMRRHTPRHVAAPIIIITAPFDATPR